MWIILFICHLLCRVTAPLQLTLPIYSFAAAGAIVLHLCNRVLVENTAVTGTWSISVVTGCVSLLSTPLFITHLPHSNNGISDEDKKDDEGLHKGGDGLLTFLEPGQHLRSEG